jgi:hypothetical protein
MASALAIQALCQAFRIAKNTQISLGYRTHAAEMGSGQEPVIACENCDSLIPCAAHKE